MIGFRRYTDACGRCNILGFPALSLSSLLRRRPPSHSPLRTCHTRFCSRFANALKKFDRACERSVFVSIIQATTRLRQTSQRTVVRLRLYDVR